MDSLNVVVAGVGGQGVLTLAKVIGEAAIASGRGALVAETHGLSQRGGSVVVHVRIGEVEAPLVPEGEGDLLISTELLEALRYASFLRREGEVVSDALVLKPYGFKGDLKAYQLAEELRRLGLRVHLVNAAGMAEPLGDVRAANMILLGYSVARTALGEFLDAREVEGVIGRGRGAEVNLKAFRLGLSMRAEG
ncbi:MAG: 2-oxoacid:acceptor oxidoreductase family protein [Acidilobaceae archaeon]|nr:2-oxoacid:acceptor oxidoreductase family protein [Acidilobaceae archaeon]MCX8165166.1 2-oxoacid:acceptor oxidoreductase family protein [Acidilobaceae archaeon]MDW7974318.1 2-oxoacid:acceptor oxidoreductase family protein [Sulfolobales archaeon]